VYYVMEPQIDDVPHVTLSRQKASQDLMFIRGQMADPALVPAPMVINAERHYDIYPDLMDVGMALACTKKLRTALEAAAVDNVQFFPAEVREDGRAVPGEFYVMNVMGRVAAMDRVASSFTEFRGKVARLKSLAVDLSKAHGLYLFRLHEYQEIVLVRENVYRALAATQLRGVMLSLANGWSDRHRF
jgi:hypothetical protein